MWDGFLVLHGDSVSAADPTSVELRRRGTSQQWRLNGIVATCSTQIIAQENMERRIEVSAYKKGPYSASSRFVGNSETGQLRISAVRTAWPATRPAHSFLKFRTHPLDVLLSGFRFLDRDNPADPLIAREWRNVLPFCPCHGVGNENLS